MGDWNIKKINGEDVITNGCEIFNLLEACDLVNDLQKELSLLKTEHESELKPIDKTQDEIITALKNRIASMMFDSRYRKNEVLYEPVTHDEYAKAIIHLFELSELNCGGSVRAAQVLLSLYNGFNFNADLADISTGLDAWHLQSALIAIKGRSQLNTEPHRVIQDGDIHFRKLCEDWFESLRVDKRYAKHYKAG